MPDETYPSLSSLRSDPAFPACLVGRSVSIDGTPVAITGLQRDGEIIAGLDLRTKTTKLFLLAASLRAEGVIVEPPKKPAKAPPTERALKPFRPADAPSDFENSPGIRDVLDALDTGTPVVLVTGRAGTGKTTLIRHLRTRAGGNKQAVVAPTGVAALNARAQTIHSFFQLPISVLDAENLPPMRGMSPLFKNMTRLVIDEISMVRADIIDAIDARLRTARADGRPFGGVQVVMVGDFLQLPPVVDEQQRPVLQALGYESEFAFSAHVMRRVESAAFSLERVYRQDEKDFIDLLNAVRTGENTGDAVASLNARCLGPHRDEAQPLILAPTRNAVDRYNREGMASLPGAPIVWTARTLGTLDVTGDRLPVPEHLELRVGARVMAVKNDPQTRWINGSLGTVVGLEEKGATVRFDRTKTTHLIEAVSWEKVKQVWNERKQQVETEVLGAYQQIPLVPAWAITIHKAQGLTLDDVRLDLGSGAFAPGQLYVALSRVRTMAGLSLARALHPSDLRMSRTPRLYDHWLAAKLDG